MEFNGNKFLLIDIPGEEVKLAKCWFNVDEVGLKN